MFQPDTSLCIVLSFHCVNYFHKQYKVNDEMSHNDLIVKSLYKRLPVLRTSP